MSPPYGGGTCPPHAKICRASPEWHLEDENLKENDLIYFKLTDSKLAADWKLGKVEYVNIGRDGKVRSVGISHKIMIEHANKVYHEDLGWKHSVVERPVREIDEH